MRAPLVCGASGISLWGGAASLFWFAGRLAAPLSGVDPTSLGRTAPIHRAARRNAMNTPSVNASSAHEQTLDFLESQIPALAAAAVVVAHHNALASGLSVLQIEGDELIEQFPDGSRRVVKTLIPRVPVVLPVAEDGS